MKKLFTLAAAVLASFSLMAAVVTWRPSSADVTELVKTTSTAVTVGTGDQSFQVYSIRPFYNTNSVKIEWDATNNAVKTTDNGMDKSGLAVYIPADAVVEGITVFMHQSNTRKTYYADAAATKPASSGTSTDVIAKTSTGYDFWTTFDAEKYYAFGGKNSGSGDLWYDSIKVTFKDATEPILKSIKIAGVDCEIVKAADAADPDTIKGELPYGTVIADAIQAISAEDFVLGGTATSLRTPYPYTSVYAHAENGDEKEYFIACTVNTSVSTDATLKALSINGVEIALVADKYSYDVELSYATEINVVAEANDAAAKNVAIDKSVAGKVTITVTAQSDDTQDYVINYTLLPAKKALLEAAFSNGAKGAITNGKIRVPYLAGEAEPTFTSAKFWNADGEPTAVVEGGNLKVTGIDGVDSLYAIETVALTPASVTYDTEITFDSTETYIFSTYGWASDKGWKIAKDVEEASNHRISDGRARIYFALPKAASVSLVSGSGGERPIKIFVNGEEFTSVTKTGKSNNAITITLDSDKTNLVAIESNGSNGDGGFIKMTVAEPIATALGNTEAEVKAVKVIRNGQLFIEKNGVLYNAQGVVVR